ncbi:hypothetical protein JOD62_000204 [Microbacterium keratanolyticum]|uniref:Uncharacterized protein n=1 Tax=Microbacterium keratanolyticum TaxID=67574 RepID=A0A9W6M9J9_9MICO|nr:hypothetical protein [Microbacterium keratanolyticum]MBM7467656.1 hypothetical protein [Microbacterium keratanolyticum]GLK02648.1 hypothetical protein GCM10017596_23630 [Microbacterium keratanolyticum]
MREDLPFGWLAVPFSVDPSEAPALARALLTSLASASPEVMHTPEAEELMVAAITRLPVRSETQARVWHVLGPDATGLSADLSVADPIDDLESDIGSPFKSVLLQRRFPTDTGVMTLALVAPDVHAQPLLLLRAQRVLEGRRLIADILSDDPGFLGRVAGDAAALVGAKLAEPGANADAS